MPVLLDTRPEDRRRRRSPQSSATRLP